MTMASTANHPYALTQEYSPPCELDSQAWFTDSGASHHLTPFETCLKNRKAYKGKCQVHVGNRYSLYIKTIGTSYVKSKLILNGRLHVPATTKN